MDLESLERRLVAAERLIEREVGEAQAIIRQAKESKAEAEALREQQECFEEAAGFLNSFADLRQAEIQQKVEQLVTHGLQTIFDSSLRFKVVQEVKARRMETRFVVVSSIDGEDLETDVLNSRGGGVAAVVGFLLRLVIVLLQPNRRHFLFLDETFGQLSSDREVRLAAFMKELVEKTSVQIVLVTHSDAYSEVADVVYRFSLKNGMTNVEAIGHAA